MKKIFAILLIIIILMNVVAFFHAYKFTHFSEIKGEKTKSPEKLSLIDKFKTLFLGVSNPRPINDKYPSQKFEIIKIQSNRKIECWKISVENTIGTVAIFHGYGGNKSGMIEKSDEFLKIGFNTILIDFMGSGGSEGNQTTIGFKEAEQIKSAFDYLKENGEKNIYLYGNSMGSAAILKAINDYKLSPKGIIIECPFGSMLETTKARFRHMNAPVFPMAYFLVFWGGIQNGFWAFDHNPTEYAKNVNCPALLLYGGKDKNVTKREITDIFRNLPGEKTFKVYRNLGHENYFNGYKNEWVTDVKIFLKQNQTPTVK